MTLRIADYHDQSVILNLFQDLQVQLKFWFSLCMLPKGALHLPSAFDTPNNALLGFEVFSRLLRQRLRYADLILQTVSQ